MASFPMDASLMYPYAKEHSAPADAFIVEDGAGLSQGHGLPEIPSDQFMPFQGIPPAFPFTAAEPWAEPITSTTGAMPRNIPAPVAGMGPQPIDRDTRHFNSFPSSLQSLETRWLDSLESQLPSNMTSPSSFSTVPQRSLFIKDETTAQDLFSYKSESSSVSDDVSAAFEYPFSATADDVPAFAERQLDEESAWKESQKEESPSEISPPQTATAFVVSEDPLEPLFSNISSAPSRSRTSPLTQRTPAKPQPLAVQSAATIKKRKKRTSIILLNEDSPKPLQIVQEDGQGGSIASADFVSPPRGARRKGPLSMAGRANAGMRRKNKDTCVQCRLNKRKVSSSGLST
jgi:hypothetical protein